MNPFTYTNNPQTLIEAQSNINYWWFEGMECPADQIEANWNTFIREMKRAADRDMQHLLNDEKIVHGVNHKDTIAALMEPDIRFNKGCFSHKPAEALYLDDEIMINDIRVLTYNPIQGESDRYLLFTDEGLKIKDEIHKALQKLISEHKIFVEIREKETLEGMKNSLNDYISR